MVHQVIERLLCDIHDGEADATSTAQLGFNGKQYEIDLCQPHADELERAVFEWADYGRPRSKQTAHRKSRERGKTSRASTDDKVDTAAVRAWANQQGLKVGERGRLPTNLLVRYHAAH